MSPEPPDDVALKMRQLGSELVAVANDQIARAAKLKEVEHFLGNLKVKDFPELAESSVIQQFVQMFDTKGMRPGETRNAGTLAAIEHEWSWSDIQDGVRSGKLPLVRFTPNETIKVTFNGLQLQLIADQECEVPRCFFDIYMEHRKALRQAVVNENYLMGISDVPPDPNWMTPESAIVRAWSTQGRRYGRVSGHLGTGPIVMGEETGGKGV